MKTKSKLFSLFLSGVIASMLLISCEENSNDIDIPSIPDIETKSADVNDITYADEVVDEVTDIADEAMELYDSRNSSLKKGGKFQYSRLNECVTVTIEITSEYKIITIDFGEEGCEGKDGRIRTGQIVIKHTGNYWDGSEMHFSFVNYFVDGNQVIGEKHVIRSFNADSLRVENIIAEGAVIFADSSGTLTRSAEYERIVVEGSDTRKKRDDVISRTGGSICTLTDGTQITSTILDPLIRKNEPGCFMFFVSGIKEIVKGDESPITIDYGDGTCDNLAEITQDGITEVIELKSHRNKKH